MRRADWGMRGDAVRAPLCPQWEEARGRIVAGSVDYQRPLRRWCV